LLTLYLIKASVYEGFRALTTISKASKVKRSKAFQTFYFLIFNNSAKTYNIFVRRMEHRYFIFISFNGTRYAGWQVQPNAVTVQQILTEKIAMILRHPVEITGAGRTDSGVHARYMVAHFNSSWDNLASDKWFSIKLNKVLPPDIAVWGVKAVIPEAHARFDALSRTYHYTISRFKDPFCTDFAWQFSVPLDINKMNECCHILLQNKDFQSFCKYHHNANNYICNIKEVFWTETDNKLIMTITADRFLRNMVRAIVGTMLEVGKNKQTVKQFEEIIKKKDRIYAGQSVMACGLSLDDIQYPIKLFI
jgi:tRNA pseudouridine38-40 synthase